VEVREHQKKNVEEFLKRKRLLICDDMGTGKTLSSLFCYKAIPGNRSGIVITCGKALLDNWVKEASKLSISSAVNIEKPNFKENKLYLYNIEKLRNKALIAQIKAGIKADLISCLIVDEIHKLAKPTSQQARGLLSLQTEYKIGLSGTILNKNLHTVYPALKFVGGWEETYTAFKERFCVFGFRHSIAGYKNVQELKDILHRYMTRTELKELKERDIKDETIFFDKPA